MFQFSPRPGRFTSILGSLRQRKVHFLVFINFYTYEPPHDKNQQCGCAHSQDSNQPGHPPSLIGVFAVCMKKAWVLSYPLSAQRILIRLGGCPGWSESLLGACSLCWFCHEAAHILYTIRAHLMIVGEKNGWMWNSDCNYSEMITPTGIVIFFFT